MSFASHNPTLLAIRLSAAYSGKQVLRDVEIDIRRGEVLGLVGQSGSGKSTLAMAILGLLDKKKVRTEGLINFEGHDLLQLSERELRSLRGRAMSLVLQSPLSSLNPALKIRTQLKEAWLAHSKGSKAEGERAIRNSLSSVSLPSDDEFQCKYPSQMSVGQAQRVLIAMAIMHRPALLIADEATSALDVITQSEILALFRELNRSTGMAILYISHDLASVAGICDRIAILHEGKIVECGTTEQTFTCPQHPYTQRLMAALPRFPNAQAGTAARAAASQ
ncbi:MAG: ABC transporter ATP-binding protein [Candidatus Sulfotelmatobacter sp.]|jgi:ABC-type dipeptide/oligopeptide/nickel transport system ATPase component